MLASPGLSALPPHATPPDPVLEWIQITNDTAIAGGTNPLLTSRVVALVSSAVYDAVNGIEPRFQPFHVKPNAPHPALQRAAAIQAAYAILVNLYPYDPNNPNDRNKAIHMNLDAQLKPLSRPFRHTNPLPPLTTEPPGGRLLLTPS